MNNRVGDMMGGLRLLLAVAFLVPPISCRRDEPPSSPAPAEDASVSSPDAPETPPEIDTSRMQPAVRERFREARQNVLDHPRSAEAWGTLGAVCDVHELWREAVLCYRRAMELDETDFRWPYLLAFAIDRLRGDSEEVVSLYRKTTELNPSFAPGFFRLGEALTETGAYQDARRALERALTLDPELAVAHYALGQTLLCLHQPDDAIGHFKRILRTVPDDAPTWSALAQAYLQTGRRPQAREAAGRAQSLEPTLTYEDPIRGAVAAQGASTRVAYRRASELLAAGGRANARAALPYLRILLSVHPDDPHVVAWMGIAQLRLGDGERAKSFLDRAGAMRDRFVHNPFGVDLSEEIARFDRAYAEFRREYLEAVVAQGSQEEIAEALSVFQEAFARTKPTAIGHLSWGNALVYLGRTQEAVAHYFKALKIDPKYAKAYYNLGFVMEHSDRIEEAVSYYEQAARLDPEGPAPPRLKRLLAQQQGTDGPPPHHTP